LTVSASLDYESAETYKYLQEILDPDYKEREAKRRISASRLPVRTGMEAIRWNNFARNYFEAMGMLGPESEKDRDIVISQALGVIRAGAPVKYKTKYNSARCLTRIHPSSPDPYFKWATQEKWEELTSGNHRVVEGFAVRGFHQRKLKVGRTPPEGMPGRS
jgi:hypothetical protein